MNDQMRPGQCFKTNRGIYGKCVDIDDLRRGIIYARCYSRMCPTGESGNVRVDDIVELIEDWQFDSAISSLR
jgi:hypothetical protein